METNQAKFLDENCYNANFEDLSTESAEEIQNGGSSIFRKIFHGKTL